MRTISTAALLALLAGAPHQEAAPEEHLIELEGLITDSSGAVIPGVTVVISGGGTSHSTVSGDAGRWSFRIPAGVYDLDFRLVGFAHTRLLQLDVPRHPAEPLLVVLPRLVLDSHPGVVDTTERLEAPALDLAFVTEGAYRVGGAVRGKLIIENIGESVFEVPTRHEAPPEFRDPAHLGLSLSMSVPYEDAGFFRYYYCTPGQDCLKLAPGQGTALEVALTRIQKPASGRRALKTFDTPGIRNLKCSLTIILPGQRERATHPLTAEFKIAVQSN